MVCFLFAASRRIGSNYPISEETQRPRGKAGGREKERTIERDASQGGEAKEDKGDTEGKGGGEKRARMGEEGAG